MAPRKRAPPSSSSKKSNPNPHQSQPAKFGIQHFFERHSQAIAAAATPPSTLSVPANPPHEPEPCQCGPSPSVVPAKPPAEEKDGEVREDPSSISPEASKAVSIKRFKFSPGLLIKQSQDDGVDEVTWKISPVNERLRSFTTKLPRDIVTAAPVASKLSTSGLRPCSRQNSPCMVGRIDKWMSSQTMVAPDRTSGYSKRVSFCDVLPSNGGDSNGELSIVSAMDLHSPFRTPPSVSYVPIEPAESVFYSGSDQLGSTQHRKALIELLDQVENSISVDVPLSDCSGQCLIEGQKERGCKMGVESDAQHTTSVDRTAEGELHACSNHNLLVLEVLEKHQASNASCMQQPVKVLRLLNEQIGQERILHLCDEWFYSQIGPGDTVNIVGEFNDQGRCIIDRNNNIVIVHPHILVSGTRVASSFSCPRRAVLDERLKITERSTAALIGTLLHQIFQAGLLKDFPTRAFMEEYAGIILQQNVENLYACGVSESDTYAALIEAIPRMLNWINIFRDEQDLRKAVVDFGQYEREKSLTVSEVIDIEEMARAPRYGLKGMIDASIRIKMRSLNDVLDEKIIPLEFKTGKGTIGQAAMEHQAQVILYTLLMSERYRNRDIDSGLIYYLHTDQTQGIKVQRSDLVGIIMRRNELASDILRASTVQSLPPMLRSPSMCKSCRHLNVCAVYHKAHGGDRESSGIEELFDSLVDHLNISHCDFLQHWDRLIDLEAKACLVAKEETLRPLSSKKEKHSLSSVVLYISEKCSVDESSRNGRYIYHFVHKDTNSGKNNGLGMDVASSSTSNLDCALRCGDYVVLSTESGHTAVACGVIADISHFRVSVALPRRLRLPGCSPSTDERDLTREIWRIDKDEVASSYAIMRFNLMQLFLQSAHSSHLRKMIVELEAPKFDSGGVVSQDPAITYVRSEHTLNDDQRRAIHKILAAKDYALILGMPGTGKTSTMVHAVKALLIRGASILLTSYTNSAVDNLLIKLKTQGVDFIRIGRKEAVHDSIREHCPSGKQNLKDVEQKMEHVRVVGVTCLGINHPLLARRKFDMCIMDEAGQIALPVSLGPLMFAMKFVLVGDHYQLPPLVQSTEAQENGLGISLFCRLSEAHPQAISALQCQYRMCAGIMELSNALIYGNRLRCGSPDIENAKLKFSCAKPLTSWLKEVLDPNKSVVFVNTDMLPAHEMKEEKTINNPTEAYIVSEVVKELVNRDVAGEEIGIITPYNSQVDLIRHAVRTPVEIHTIDKYQGRDKDCILVSFVRSSDHPTAFMTSLLGDWHRINVALTRAKKKLIMVGSCMTLSRVPLLKLLIEKVSEQAGIFTISNEDIHRMKELKRCTQQRVQ